MMRFFLLAAPAFAASVLTVVGDQVLPMNMVLIEASFSQDGQSLAVLGGDRKVSVWDLPSGKNLRSFESNPGQRSFLLASGSQFTTVATNGAVRIRDNGSGRVIASYEFPAGSVFNGAMAATPDGGMLAAALKDPAVPSSNLVHVMDRSGKPRFRVPAGVGGVSSMAFSPDGETLVAAAYDTDIRVWDVRTGSVQRVIEGLTVSMFGLAFSPDGKYLATAGADRTIYLWDTRSWKIARKITGQPETINKIRFSPDGTMLATGGMNELNFATPVKIILWDFATGRQLHAWPAEHMVRGLSFSPDGKQVAVADGTKSVKLFAVPNQRSASKR